MPRHSHAALTYRLDEPTRLSGIHAAGSSCGIVKRLDEGAPLHVAVLGASVAVRGGCRGQPHQECMRYPSGFILRWWDWLNATWPHREHALFNGGIAASNVDVWLPCLYTHLPAKVDLVLLELGSMAHWQKLRSIERLTRQLLTLDPPPALAFFTVPLWHELPATTAAIERKCALLNGTRAAGRFTKSLREAAGVGSVREAYAAVEGHIERLCDHYGQACLSMRRALGPSAHAGRPGFSLAEIASDCLHPSSGEIASDGFGWLRVASDGFGWLRMASDGF